MAPQIVTTERLRRRAERHVVHGRALAHFPRIGVTAVIRDLSRGGFAIESQRVLVPESAHDVVLRHGRHAMPGLRVRIAHARWFEDRQGVAWFLIGCEFVTDATTAHTIDELLRGLGLAEAPQNL